jgi:hypothetical protein
MGLPPKNYAFHLDLAARKGLGPSSPAEVILQGDPLRVVGFLKAQVTVPPMLWPSPVPAAMSFRAGGAMRLYYRPVTDSYYRLEVISDPDETPGVVVWRTIFDWTQLPAASGVSYIEWDGRDDAGNLLPPGRYLARLLARYSISDTNPKKLHTASSFLTVLS